jgi:hypothetical protein
LSTITFSDPEYTIHNCDSQDTEEEEEEEEEEGGGGGGDEDV